MVRIFRRDLRVSQCSAVFIRQYCASNCVFRVSIATIYAKSAESNRREYLARAATRQKYSATRLFPVLFSLAILFSKTKTLFLKFRSIRHPSCMHFICRFKHFPSSLDSLKTYLPEFTFSCPGHAELHSLPLLQVTSSIARSERERAFGHLGTPWAHG